MSDKYINDDDANEPEGGDGSRREPRGDTAATSKNAGESARDNARGRNVRRRHTELSCESS